MMTTQLISSKQHDSQLDASNPSMAIGPQPGSPTLTNPDMILPDYNDLMGYNDLPQPQRPIWNGAHSSSDGLHYGSDNNNFYVNPNPLATPFIYGNGTMLSDIGEVTEVESNAGGLVSRGNSRRATPCSPDDFGRLSSAQARSVKHKFARPARRISIDSTSTIGPGERTSFLDFDDTISLGGDSNCQGDDEESLASSFAEEFIASQSIQVARQLSLRRVNDEASANSMSKRAEEILANAKQRLTDMEDNLSRARSLSYVSKREALAAANPDGRPASTICRGASAPPGASALRKTPSEESLPDPALGDLTGQRASSALGTTGGYRRALPASRSVEALDPGTDRGAYTIPHRNLDLPVESLGKDHYADTISNRHAAGGSPTTVLYDSDSPRSSIQVRDLQDQMNGLKGKISSLREQARADSLKRRSLQTLRTPSPLTHADWSSVVTDSRKQHTSDNDPIVAELRKGLDDDEQEMTPRQEKFPAFDAVAEEEVASPMHKLAMKHGQQAQTISPKDQTFDRGATAQGPQGTAEPAVLQSPKKDGNDQQHRESQRTQSAVDGAGASCNDNSTVHHTNGDATDSEGYESEGGESLYHEASQHQISHEDREDAFDYEHFFLHSAMGALRVRSGSVDSVESSDSVATARGPPEIAPKRRPSVDTIASMDSFRTATEGMNSCRNSVASGYMVYMPGTLTKSGRPSSIMSIPESSSGSDSIVAAGQETRRRPNSMQLRPTSQSISAKPSFSSFASTGTTRSFPLVTKGRRNSSINSSNGVLTPGSSPDHGTRSTPKTGLQEAPTIHVQEKTGGDGVDGIGAPMPSPAVQMLAPEDRKTVEALVAELGKCVLVLGEPSGDVSADGAHDVYRRRLEIARQILEGTVELP